MEECNMFLEDLEFIRSNIYKNPRQARMTLDSLINYCDVKKRPRSVSGLVRFVKKEIWQEFKDFVFDFNEKNNTNFGSSRLVDKRTIVEFHGLDENGTRRDKFNYKDHIETLPGLMLKKINQEKKDKAEKSHYTKIIYTPMGNKR